MKSDNSEEEREIVRLSSEKRESAFEETWESENTESESIGGLQPISRDTVYNAAMYNRWWTNKRS